jgi:hypothetical protein
MRLDKTMQDMKDQAVRLVGIANDLIKHMQEQTAEVRIRHNPPRRKTAFAYQIAPVPSIAYESQFIAALNHFGRDGWVYIKYLDGGKALFCKAYKRDDDVEDGVHVSYVQDSNRSEDRG